MNVTTWTRSHIYNAQIKFQAISSEALAAYGWRLEMLLAFTQFGFLGNNQRAASQRLINYNFHTEFNFEPFSLTFRFGVDFEQLI